jgi:hypothetical protein
LSLASCKKEESSTSPTLKAKPTTQNYDASICYDWYNGSDGSYITTTGYCGDAGSGTLSSVPPSPSYPGQVVGVPHEFGGSPNNIPLTNATDPPQDLNYSGDAVDTPDPEADSAPACPGSGDLVRMPDFVETAADHSGVRIQFGMTTSDNLSADQMVRADLVQALEAALVKANTPPRGPAGAKPFTPIYIIYIKATTNGSHAAASNHAKGTAVDISRINEDYIANMPITGTYSDLVYRLQSAFSGRENFGPAIQTKLGQPYPVSGHEDHVHFSVNCK